MVGRFNERFMLTLGDCKSCLICDDELNVLPLSSHARDIVPLPPVDGEKGRLNGMPPPCMTTSKALRCTQAGGYRLVVIGLPVLP